jgi:hypothetical protein
MGFFDNWFNWGKKEDKTNDEPEKIWKMRKKMR